MPKHTHHIRLSLFALAAGMFALPLQVLAQDPIELLECIPSATGPVCFIQPTGTFPLEALNRYLLPFLPWMVSVAAGLAILMIIIGGFQIMLAGGDQGGQSAGKDRIKAALAGLLILVFSSTILNALNAFFFSP